VPKDAVFGGELLDGRERLSFESEPSRIAVRSSGVIASYDLAAGGSGAGIILGGRGGIGPPGTATRRDTVRDAKP
jgi:hypothetical protein